MFLRVRDAEGNDGSISLEYLKDTSNNTVKVHGTYTVTGETPTTFDSNTLTTPTSKDDLFLWMRKTGYTFDTRLALINQATDRSYTITFNSNGRTISVNSLTTNEYYKLDYVPIPDDEDFLGWYDENGNLITKDTVFTENTTLIARYTVHGLCFTAEQAGSTISLRQYDEPASISLEYTRDGLTWSTFDLDTTYTLTNVGDSIWIRGDNSTFNEVVLVSSTNFYFKYYYFSMGGKIAVSDSLMYLVSKNNTIPSTTQMFARLFRDCTALTSAPEFPNTNMSNYCYYGMFDGCTNLKECPELPSTSLADYCYSTMFKGCTSILSTVSLPATTLYDYCYASMFYKCTSLSHIETISATTLASYCCRYMFGNCTSLLLGTNLSATTMAEYCYTSMYSGCTSLLFPVVLNSTNLDVGCYMNMFSGCTSLQYSSVLPATTLASSCYCGMFSGCTNLIGIYLPDLPATGTLPTSCYKSMFEGCTNVVVSETWTDECTVAYRVPSSGTATASTESLYRMFTNTGGSFTGTPSVNTTYYVNRS